MTQDMGITCTSEKSKLHVASRYFHINMIIQTDFEKHMSLLIWYQGTFEEK